MTKGEQTRQKIVAAAAAIFNQRGYEGSSLSELMAATGLQKGGIYRHFSSKEELAAEAFDYTWTEARRARQANLTDTPPGLARLKQWIANFEFQPKVPGGCPILNTAVDSDDGNPLLRARVKKALQTWRESTQEMLKEAIRAGEIARGTDVEQASTIIIASLEGAIMISRLNRDPEPIRRVQRHLYAYLESLA